MANPRDIPLIREITLDTALAKIRAKELKRQRDTLQDRIDNLYSKGTLNGQPVLKHLVAMADDPAELVDMGKAMERIGQLLPALKKLDEQVNILEYAYTNPNWLAAQIGSFDHHLTDDAISIMLRNNDDKDAQA